MFIGHFAIGFAAKTAAPRVSLGTLFLAAQFIDLLWPTFLLMGLERVRIEPGATVVTPLVFEHYPWSHSLLAVLGWAALLAGLHFLLRRDRRSALILAGLVLSHWLLDLLVHRPDLPLWPWGGSVLGLRLWSSLTLTLALEVPLFMLGVWLYSRSTRPLDRTGRWGWWAWCFSSSWSMPAMCWAVRRPASRPSPGSASCSGCWCSGATGWTGTGVPWCRTDTRRVGKLVP